MPEFPRYESKNKLTTQAPAPQLNDPHASGKIAEAQAQVGGALESMAFQWSDSLNTIQKMEATEKFKTGALDIVQRASEDPDYKNLSKYQKEVNDLKNESLKTFSFPGGKMQAEPDFNLETKSLEIQLNNIYKKKAIDVGQTSTLQLLDSEIQNLSPGFEGRIKSILANATAAQLFDNKGAYELEKQYISKGRYNAFLNDLNTDPNIAGQNLSNNAYQLDAAQLAKAKKAYTLGTKKFEQMRKQSQLDLVNNFGEQLAKGELTPDEIQNAVISGSIDAEMGASFELAMAAPERWTEFVGTKKDKLEPSLRAGNFIKPLEALAGSNDVDSKMKIIKSALQNRVDGKLDASDLNFILRVASGKSKDPSNPIWGHLKSAIASLPPLRDSGFIVEKFKSRWDMEQDPRPVMQQAAIDQFKEDHPETAAYQKGDVIKRKSGSYEVIGHNEDGSPVLRKK